MIDAIEHNFCKIFIYDFYLVVEMNEGIHLTPEDNQVLINVTDVYFKNKPFVYITHRVNSYSVDPAIYLRTAKIPNLIGFAVVGKTPTSSATAKIEKLFFNKPFEIFSELQEAISWAEKVVQL